MKEINATLSITVRFDVPDSFNDEDINHAINELDYEIKRGTDSEIKIIETELEDFEFEEKKID